MYYKKLKAKYYEMFPKELKLEFGCEVIVNNKMDDIVLEEQTPDNKVRLLVTGDVYTHIIKILGKDIDIREVLRMIEQKEKDNIMYSIHSGGAILEEKDGRKIPIIKIDLSKPLKEQEDACKQILKIIK